VRGGVEALATSVMSAAACERWPCCRHTITHVCTAYCIGMLPGLVRIRHRVRVRVRVQAQAAIARARRGAKRLGPNAERRPPCPEECRFWPKGGCGGGAG